MFWSLFRVSPSPSDPGHDPTPDGLPLLNMLEGKSWDPVGLAVI